MQYPSPARRVPAGRVILILLSLFLAAALTWLAWNLTRTAAGSRVYGSLLAGVSLLAAGASLRVAVRSERPRLRLAWGLFAAGALLASLKSLLAFLPVASQTSSLTLDELSSLLSLLLFSAGLLLHPRRARRPAMPVLTLIDITVAESAILTTFWIPVLRPLIESFPGQLEVLLYPTLGLLLLMLLVGLFLENDIPVAPPSLLWAMLGLAVLGLAALLHAFLLQRGLTGFMPLPDFAWVVGIYGLALGALAYPAVIWQEQRSRMASARFLARFQPLLPGLLTLLMGWQILITWLLTSQLYPSGMLIVALLGLGLLARRTMAAGEGAVRPYASLVNSVAEPAFVCDQDGLLRLVNPALLAAAGYSSADALLEKPLANILDASADIPCMLDHALARNAGPNDTRPIGWSGETALRRRDGSLIPVFLSLRTIQPDPRLPEGISARLALAGTAHDLTHQKRQQAALQAAYQQIAQAREQLELLNAGLERKVAEETENLNQANRQLEIQNRKLQNLDQLKSDFVSLVSHELRAPLTNISGGIELVLSRQAPLADGVRANLELVQAETQRLARFVETILDLSALDAGRMPIHLGRISYESVVQILQDRLLHLPGVERIHWDLAPVPALWADERALTSVLFHLLDNAMKYAPQGDIDVKVGQQGPYVRVSVIDHGPGIPPETLPLLYDRFYRGNVKDSQTVYGHGLGLYIVRRLVEAMGGAVEASNIPEGGACFTLSLRKAGENDHNEEKNAL